MDSGEGVVRLSLVVGCPQVARAGRFGTKGLALTFVSDENDAKILNDVQERFEVNITELPDEIDISSYSTLTPGGRCTVSQCPSVQGYTVLVSYPHTHRTRPPSSRVCR